MRKTRFLVIAALVLPIPSAAMASDALFTGQTLSAGLGLFSADGHYASASSV